MAENYGTGRRKTSVARVRLIPGGNGKVIINGKLMKDYIGNLPRLEKLILHPLILTNNESKFDVRISVVGGGISSQAGAIRHGISRALLENNEENKPVLRQEGLLTRDSRIKERKKYGRKRARKRFQFSKR